MTNRLQKRYDKLSEQIIKLEKERMLNRDFNHKTLLISLKKQKLKIKTELENV